jgi:hypothetical protein
VSLGVGRDVAQRLKVLRDEEELRDLLRGEPLLVVVCLVYGFCLFCLL